MCNNNCFSNLGIVRIKKKLLINEKYIPGSFSGAETSQKVTEVYKGIFILFLYRIWRVMAKICLTVRYTNQTEIFNKKVGHSDPKVPGGRAFA